VVRTEPVKPGLTFHGLRHSHKTWMIADLVPEIAQATRLGHTLQNKIQQTYSHVAAQVEQRLLDGLQASWEKAIANAEPRSDVSYRLGL
jgi:integrase